MLKKIAVIGPESTGKSILCKLLAAHYQTGWVKEYAREYLQKNGTAYRFEDLYTIAEGQLQEEENGEAALLSNNTDATYLFIDTDMHVIKVWSEFVFNKCDNRILTRIANREYDLYLLCNTDVAWVKDELREYPDLETREKLFYYYKDAMVNQHVPWLEIKGNYEERLAQAIEAVDKL